MQRTTPAYYELLNYTWETRRYDIGGYRTWYCCCMDTFNLEGWNAWWVPFHNVRSRTAKLMASRPPVPNGLLQLISDSNPRSGKKQTPQHLGRTHNHMKEMQFSSIKMPLTVEIISELPCVGEGLDHTVHKTSISQIDQSSEARETHFLLLYFFSSLTARRRSVSHGLHHAGGLGLWRQKDKS